MQTSASACARRVRGAARTPRAWRHWLCDARAVPAARIHGRCVTGKDIALIAEQTLQHTSSSATNSARIIIFAQLVLGWRDLRAKSGLCAHALASRPFQPQPETIIGQTEASCGSRCQQ